MKNNLIIGLFICLASIQIITPLSMITKRESILKNGEQFKFKTAPVDPYDAFRGRYVALQIEENGNILVSQDTRLSYGQNVYALISIDEGGFAKFTTLTTTKPAVAPFIQTKVRHIVGDKAQLDLPIDRYYMEEKAAPEAEKIYRQHSRQDKQDAYVLVRVKDGFAVIEALYVGGRRIEDAVKEAKNK
jgi:uncharacterized membrane-anchored protein